MTAPETVFGTPCVKVIKTCWEKAPNVNDAIVITAPKEAKALYQVLGRTAKRNLEYLTYCPLVLHSNLKLARESEAASPKASVSLRGLPK